MGIPREEFWGMTHWEFSDRLEAWTEERQLRRHERAREVLAIGRFFGKDPVRGEDIFELVTGEKISGGPSDREEKLDALWQESHERAMREKAGREKANGR